MKNFKFSRVWILSVFMMFLACSFVPTADIFRSANGYWLYQLQDMNPADSAIGSFITLVTDYSRDGTDAGRYTADEISAIQAQGTEVLSYISIGEAETYRYYWQSAWETSPPAWLGRENKDWGGNYKVKYWYSEWQSIIYGYLDKIISAGYDGVYMDIIDAYEYWADNENGEDTLLTEAQSAAYMIEFVKNIAEYCRTNGNTNFQVYPQNGSPILDYDSDGSYLSEVSGIGVEDVFYNGTTERSEEDVSFRLNYLNQFRSAGKKVIVVDYVDNGAGYVHLNSKRISNFIALANENGFIPYVARKDRALNSVNVIEGVQP